MLDRLPEHIDPIQLADKQGILKGQIPINSLNRLKDFLENDAGEISVELFFRREGRYPRAEGTLKGTLQLTCQNCLEAVELPVDIAVKLGIVTTIDQADRLPEGYEPLMVTGEKVLAKDIIEDELLLILPTYPKHQQACFVKTKQKYKADEQESSAAPARENPFSILANLKNTGDL